MIENRQNGRFKQFRKNHRNNFYTSYQNKTRNFNGNKEDRIQYNNGKYIKFWN